MKSILAIALIILPLTADAFSEDFKQYMTTLQTRVMYRGEKYTPEEMQKVWERFDEEIVSLLSKYKTIKELNAETAPTVLTYLDRKGEERELVELGTLAAQFHKLGSEWLVALDNGMAVGPSTTFHIYKKVEGKYTRVAALEEATGPWDRDKLLTMTMQIQIVIPFGGMKEFSSYHKLPRLRANRSQIVWQYDKSGLRPSLWIPEVDWHVVDGVQVAGRGEVFSVTE